MRSTTALASIPIAALLLAAGCTREVPVEIHGTVERDRLELIAESNERIVEIAVREATGILDIPDSALEGIGGGADGFVKGVASVGGQLISLLNLSPLMAATATGVRHV